MIMNRKVHEKEYMSSDIWKRNVPPVTNFKRGSLENKIGMWIMWLFYGIVIIQVIHAMTVIPFFPITFTILSGLFFIWYVAWRAT